MTMQRPHPRIIHIKLQNHITRRISILCLRQDLCIPSLRISRIYDGATVIIAVSFVENEEVVTVEMHGVGGMIGGDVAAEDKPDGVVGAEIVDVPLGVVGVGCVA